jgi:hypothetical protein
MGPHLKNKNRMTENQKTSIKGSRSQAACGTLRKYHDDPLKPFQFLPIMIQQGVFPVAFAAFIVRTSNLKITAYMFRFCLEILQVLFGSLLKISKGISKGLKIHKIQAGSKQKINNFCLP